MDDIPLGLLLGSLFILIVLSAFFSSSETAMMALNRYRLQHLAESGHRSALLAQKLLNQPDRLLGTILLGNNLVNMAAAAIATVIAIKVYGDAAIAVATLIITLVILIFAEVPPKTLAAMYPERIAFPAVHVLNVLIYLAQPLVYLVNLAGNSIMRFFPVSDSRETEHLSADELRTVLKTSGSKISTAHQEMLLRILELDRIQIDDVMVPRSSIEAIDINDDWDDIVKQLATSHHTRLPVYEDNLDKIIGILHLRKVLYLSKSSRFDKRSLRKMARKPYFIPEGARLTQQLLALRDRRRQMGIVVDEYGDVRGLVTLEEILEEIVGEFTSQIPGMTEQIHAEEDGSFLVDGGANIRDLNRKQQWSLPTDGPKTVNGLILDYFEDIPESGQLCQIGRYQVEVVQSRGTGVHVARIRELSPDRRAVG